ncbi:MAG: VOC family protein [Bacteroidales bacterium]|jgi:glyoxylase I family protein|nr:VOC family protein [Bacteroidales bacterium]
MEKVILGMDHPAIAAEDVAKLAKWYCDVLGYKIFAATDQPVYIIEAPDGTYMEIMPQDGSPRPQRDTGTPGLSHLAFRVADFDLAERTLEERHVSWVGAAFEAAGGGRIRNFFDPEGNLLQIVQR